MVRADVSAYFLGALLLLTLPLNWLAAALTAAVIHELFHIAAVKLSGGRVVEVRISAHGAVIETTPMEGGRELICAAAGPVGSLLLVLLCRIFPRVAVCGLCQGIFNLLPIFPLDGGRVLRCGLELLVPKWADRIAKWTETGILGALAALAVAGAIAWNIGVLPLIAVVFLMRKVILRKRPCK